MASCRSSPGEGWLTEEYDMDASDRTRKRLPTEESQSAADFIPHNHFSVLSAARMIMGFSLGSEQFH